MPGTWGTPFGTTGTPPAFGWHGQQGYYGDGDTSLVHLGARYYAPNLARFLSRDPAGIAGGVNVYAYCVGDPINLVDPSGLDPDLGGLFGAAARFGLHQAGQMMFNPAGAALEQAQGMFAAAANAGTIQGEYDGGRQKATPLDVLGGYVRLGAAIAPVVLGPLGALGEGAAGLSEAGSGGASVAARLVGPSEAGLIQEAGGFVESADMPGTGMTCVFDPAQASPARMQAMLPDGYTHLAEVPMQDGWQSHWSDGGAVGWRDGPVGGFAADLNILSKMQLGPPSIRQLP